MELLCRTCGEHVVNPTTLFEENGSDVLNDLLKLTGIWLTKREGFPSHICASCLQQSREAIAFRDLCVRTNKLWHNLGIDHLMEFDETAIPEENKDNVKVELEALYEEIKPASPSGHLTSSDHHSEPYTYTCTRRKATKEPSPKVANDDERLVDPLLNEAAVFVPKEENHDGVKDISTPLSSRKPRLDPCSVPKKRVLRGSKKSNVDPLAKKPRHPSNRGYWHCEQCGQGFKEKSNFNLHLMRHTGVKQFECEECGRKEFSRHLLNLHKRVKHKGELPYSCRHCGQGFDNCTKRLRHERTMHKERGHDTRPHVCHVCRKAFKHKRDMKRHELIHTGEQPFHCEICDVYFNQKSSLRTHNRSKLHIKKAGRVTRKNEFMNEDS